MPGILRYNAVFNYYRVFLQSLSTVLSLQCYYGSASQSVVDESKL